MQRQLTNLIFDRTNADLVNETDKAYIDYEDLNRIEDACKYLADILDVYIKTKTWKMTDYRTSEEMARLRNNINIVKNAYYQNPNSPVLPSVIYYKSISEANTIEEILWDIETMYLNTINGLRRLSFRLGTKCIGNRETL